MDKLFMSSIIIKCKKCSRMCHFLYGMHVDVMLKWMSEVWGMLPVHFLMISVCMCGVCLAGSLQCLKGAT